MATNKYNIGDRLFVECEIKDIYLRKNGKISYCVDPIVEHYVTSWFFLKEEEIKFVVDTKDTTESKLEKLKRKLIEIGRIIRE